MITMTITNATWIQARKAVTGYDFLAPGYAAVGSRWQSKVVRLGIDPAEVILSATNPGFGAERHAEFVDGTQVPFLEDFELDGGWHILTQDNLALASWTCGRCGSYVTITRDGDGWTISGEFYGDCMYLEAMKNASTFMEAEAEMEEESEPIQEFADLLYEITDRENELPAFQGWWGEGDDEWWKDAPIATHDQIMIITDLAVKYGYGVTRISREVPMNGWVEALWVTPPEGRESEGMRGVLRTR